MRQQLGKEYFILKRKLYWLYSDISWAKQSDKTFDGFSIKKHKSVIKRKLKDIDTYLQENKRTNLQLAINHINNIVVKQDEIFSFWKLVGRPTKKKGYIDGLSLNQGKIEKDIGGGLCQLGNLLFWIFAHSPLSIIQRFRHSFDVFPDTNRDVPFGAGATLSYNYIDFQVKNNTKDSFVLKLWLDEKYIHGDFFCSKQLGEIYEIQERNHSIKQQFWGAYTRHNEIYKITKDKYGRTTEKFLFQNNAIMMYNPLLK